MSQDIKERLRYSAAKVYDRPAQTKAQLAGALLDAVAHIEALERRIAELRQAKGWISVEDRLPDQGLPVLVFSPPQPGDYPESIRIEIDFICPDYECWHNHSEHYEHFCCVAKGGSDVEFTGPSEKAPYTHWMPLPAAPSAGQAKSGDDRREG